MSLIRSTYHGRIQAMASYIMRLGAEEARAQEVASSGLEVARPSDAPSMLTHLHRVRAQAADQEIWMDNATFASGLLATADAALESMTEQLSRAREIAVQMSNETYNDEDRELAAIEVERLHDQLIGQANTEYAGRYVFAGTAHDDAAYDNTGTYVGTNAAPAAPIGTNFEVATGFDGSALLQSHTDPFLALRDLQAALESGDADQVASQLDTLDKAIEQLSSARALVGEQLGRTDDAVELAETMQTELQRQVAAVTDADMVDSYVRLVELQGAYAAALEVVTASRTTPLFSLL